MIHFSIMRTASVADLRNRFATISAWIENGETVQIVKRGRPFGTLTPPVPTKKPFSGKEYWANRQKELHEIWGGRVFSMEEVEEMRAWEREGEEG